MRVRSSLIRTLVGSWTLVALAVVDRPPVVAQSESAYSVLTRDGRRPLNARRVGAADLVALDDLAAMFGLSIREDEAAGGITITRQGQTIVLSPAQALASVGGRVVSLPAPAVREGRAWFVPVEFVNRALGPALGTRVDLRKPSRLIIVGDLRVPRVTARVDVQDTRVRLTFEVDPGVRHRVAQDGRRLIVSFDADALDAQLEQPRQGSLAGAIRATDNPPTVVVELGPAFAAFATPDQVGAAGSGRFVIELTGAVEPIQSPREPAPVASVPPPSPIALPPLAGASSPPSLHTIVIDPGHGGDEQGARGPAGALEKDVTLAVALRLKAAIEGRLGIRVVLTRETDAAVSLDERAALANTNKADVFISLHANASPRGATAGAEVFYLSLDEYGAEARRLAQSEGPAVPVFGGGTRQVELILWEMAQARHVENSATFAAIVEEELRKHVTMSARAIQQAPFRVLVGANMPAILIEMGFVTNAAEEARLVSDSHQNGIVQALVDALVRFRDRLRGAARN